jgi:methyltransferase (TIGR00027 family)
MMGVLSFVVFVALQIALIPLAVLGVAVVGYKQILVSKRLGVSQTGIEVLNGRWTMHVFGMREDVATARLANVLPNTSTFGLWLALIPLWVKYKLSGSYFGYPRVPEEGAEGISDLVVARTLYFDRIIERVVGDTEQFILLGAGYDTRAYGPLKREGIAFFELDQAPTQRLKISCLSKGGIDADHVTFVEVDFAEEDAFEKLEAAGYDPSKRTLFLWEGVSLYLTEQDVRKTLRNVRDHAASGSVLVADIYGDRFMQMAGGVMAKKTLEYTDEGLGFGLPFEADHTQSLARFLESEGLTQGETFFMGTTHEKGPYMVVVECSV